MNPAPKRRWLRWTLLTLGVVGALFGWWLGYEWNWIRQRHQLLSTPNVLYSDQPTLPGVSYVIAPPRKPAPRAPGLLSLLGETGIATLLLPIEDARFGGTNSSSYTEWRHAKRLFPEADIEVYPLIAP